MFYSFLPSTGSYTDLMYCTVRETLDYSQLPFPSPPFPPNIWGASPSYIPATLIYFTDQHTTGGTFVQPYSDSAVYLYQTYQYSCPCANDGEWTQFSPDLVVERHVTWLAPWKFFTAKTNITPYTGVSAAWTNLP
jgi:hypothetical protein